MDYFKSGGMKKVIQHLLIFPDILITQIQR